MSVTTALPVERMTIFAGRFGSGKTEISLNYALYLADRGLSPLLIDLDIVTPYFRTRERVAEMARRGVEVVTPFAVGQHLDTPSISPRILGSLEQTARPVVVDLGGDVQGSRAIAQYAAVLRSRGYAMLFVVNPYRPFTDTVGGIAAAVREIEASSRLSVSALVSNPNLMSQSTPDLFHKGHLVVQEAAMALALPIAFVVVSESLSDAVAGCKEPTLILHRFFNYGFDLSTDRC